MKVRFLGSGDAFGSGGRFQTCLCVEAGDGAFLIDCGASSLIAMRRFGVDPNRIDAVLISHLHGDHFGGLPFLLLDAQLVSRRERPLVIAGPPGLKARLTQAREVLFPGSRSTALRFALDIRELAAGVPAAIGAITATPFAVTHASGAPAYALRVAAAGRVLAYSGDTEWTDNLIPAGRGADLFVCEAYFYEKRVRYHLDYRTVAARLPDIGARRVILTHMSGELLGRLAEVAQETAEDGMIVEL